MQEIQLWEVQELQGYEDIWRQEYVETSLCGKEVPGKVASIGKQGERPEKQ